MIERAKVKRKKVEKEKMVSNRKKRGKFRLKMTQKSREEIKISKRWGGDDFLSKYILQRFFLAFPFLLLLLFFQRGCLICPLWWRWGAPNPLFLSQRAVYFACKPVLCYILTIKSKITAASTEAALLVAPKSPKIAYFLQN